MFFGKHESGSLLQPGRNCWTIQDCRRLAFLIDGKAYFDALADALEKAEQRIAILGWDFDSRILLRPDRPAGEQLPLGPFLNRLVEQKPGLRIHVLVWRNSVFYGRGAELIALMGESWQDHPSIQFKLDDHHPLGACHHQKIVVIDDRLAFVGGIDLTQRRWDDTQHLRRNPNRRTVAGELHPSTHDVQAMVDGPVATAIAELASQRWQSLTGECLPPVKVSSDPWPENVGPVLRDHPVGVARTQPAYNAQKPAKEVSALITDMLRSAQESIYIEAQYFALPDAAEIIATQLGKRHGPEVIIVVNGGKQGLVEQFAMSENRERMFALLHQADQYDRLRVFFPLSEAVPPCPVKIHSKLMIIDGRRLRIGSANLNRRSTGLDTECDIALDARTPQAGDAVAGLRNRLLAEHLGTTEQEFAALARSMPLIQAIDRVNGHSPRLLLTAEQPNHENTELMTGSGLLDPRHPITVKRIWRRFVDALSGQASRRQSPR